MRKKKEKKEELSSLGFLGGDVSKGMCNFVLLDKLGAELEPSCVIWLRRFASKLMTT